MNRCLDVGLQAFKRHAELGVMAYNLHLIGRRLLAPAEAEEQRAA